MMKYVHLHLFRKTLSVEEIKKACRCRNNNIVSLFKQELEQDIRHYIASMRLDAAGYVMRRKRVTISLLAACVGYTEELFWRDFKAKYGCTPLQFMKANCEELRSEQTVKMLSQDAGSRQKSKTRDQRETDRSTLS
jgi:AraC-like DNA-binding protein